MESKTTMKTWLIIIKGDSSQGCKEDSMCTNQYIWLLYNEEQKPYNNWNDAKDTFNKMQYPFIIKKSLKMLGIKGI